MPRPSKYPQELRDRATRMAVDARKDPDTASGAIRRIAEQLDVHPEALRTWVKKVEASLSSLLCKSYRRSVYRYRLIRSG